MWSRKKGASSIVILILFGIVATIAFAAALIFVSQTTTSQREVASELTTRSEIEELQKLAFVERIRNLRITDILEQVRCNSGVGYSQRTNNQDCFHESNNGSHSAAISDCCCCDVVTHYFFLDNAQANRFVVINITPTNTELVNTISISDLRYYPPPHSGQTISGVKPYLPLDFKIVAPICETIGKSRLCTAYFDGSFNAISLSAKSGGNIAEVKSIDIRVLAPFDLEFAIAHGLIKKCEKNIVTDSFEQGKAYYIYWDGEETQWEYIVQ